LPRLTTASAHGSCSCGRPGTSPIRSQLEGAIVESLASNRLTLELDGRHKSIHLSRIQQIVVLP
jgi:hypothetical protein